MKRHRKFFIWIVITILVVFGVCFYIQKNEGDVKSFVGTFYSFSYPSDWEIWETNPARGLTVVYPESKISKFMNKTISTTEVVTITLPGSDGVVLDGADKIIINKEAWYVKKYKGPFDEGGDTERVGYLKKYNDVQFVEIVSGISNRNIIEFMAVSWKQN